MTSEEAIEELQRIHRSGAGDPEANHADADDVLCDLLNSLGYASVVDAYHKIEPKWYA